MEFKKKSRALSDIPTTSLPDIVFLLTIFFMVSTTFREYTGLPVDLPVAQRIKKLEVKKSVSNIWANTAGEISIDDRLVRVSDIAQVMYQKRVENPKLVVSLKFDRASSMELVTQIQEKLREADALKINYCAKYGD